MRNDSRGVPYLSLRLVDRTGSVDARMWKLPKELLDGLDGPEYVRVEGVTHEYRGMLQVKIERLTVLSREEVDEGDYVPVTERDLAALASEMESLGEELEDVYLKRLLDAMVADEDFWAAFCSAPAAKSMHHARIGGLLEHSVQCVRVARVLAGIYPVDRDLLLFGAAFHDVGKVEELSWNGGGFSYSDRGRLQGHVVLGERILRRYMEKVPGFPDELEMELSHILLSHQGEPEYGAPEQPRTLEALLVHHIDNMDARVEMFLAATENVSSGGWSSHDNPLGRALYVPPGRKG
ncbi:3'-5' exoribonuclease YhaM family protein [Rubrobacter calidifluminis]|uniref:3'-5' exoribonuclease YhaM family protein n=1 Tax=Rubrobacter calidifluminis TaxID=1392640 RepID=UPI0023616852|nr:HD domain-containing protein [Rubrobacter calidifluminis]